MLVIDTAFPNWAKADYIFTSFFLFSSSMFRSVEKTASTAANWTDMTTAGDSVAFYLTVYGCLAGANSLFTLFRAFLFAYGGICAARTVHLRLLNNILKVRSHNSVSTH